MFPDPNFGPRWNDSKNQCYDQVGKPFRRIVEHPHGGSHDAKGPAQQFIMIVTMTVTRTIFKVNLGCAEPGALEADASLTLGWREPPEPTDDYGSGYKTPNPNPHLSNPKPSAN